MPIRISSTKGLLKYSLKLSKGNRCLAALKFLTRAKRRNFSSDDLRKAALIYSYCNLAIDSEKCWLEIEARAEMAPGDFYMLGSLQAKMKKTEPAIHSLEHEIQLSLSLSESYYLSSSAIILANLLIEVGAISKAKEVLELVNPGEGGFIPNVGYKTKEELFGTCLLSPKQ